MMRKSLSPAAAEATTSVDHARQARLQLEAQFHGDIDKLCAHAHAVTQKYLKDMAVTRGGKRTNRRAPAHRRSRSGISYR